MSMNEAEAKAVVNPAIRPMRVAMGLSHWRVYLEYETLDDDTKGCCEIRVYHQRATIRFDPAKHDDVDDLLSTLRHELLHLYHAYFEMARRSAGQFLQGDPFDAVDVCFTLGAERTVGAMERLLDQFDLTPQKLIEYGSKYEDTYKHEDS